MMISSVLAGFVLFWPAVLVLFFIGFCCIVFAIFLVGSTVLVSSIFLYGLYCILRDLGLLDWVFQRIGTLSQMVSGHVKENVEKSFVFQDLRTSSKEKPCLYLCHPHGLYGLTWFIHFASRLSAFPDKERPVLAVHSIFFQLPILRELFQAHHCIEANESEIKATLQKGTSVALLVGGIEELLCTEANVLNLVLRKREGYARIAKEMQVNLVPLVSPGETNLFPSTQDPLWKWMETWLYERWRLAFPLPSWKSLSSWIQIAYKPFAKPLITYILEPVEPDGMSLEDIKSAYINRLETFSKIHTIPIAFKG
jgi:hypothetical protein